MKIVKRVWINQPSTLDILHHMHGAIGFAGEYHEGSSVFYPQDGQTESMIIPARAHSDGWPTHLVNQEFGWTYCEDALPQIELSDRLFDEVQFIVTDGDIVTTCGWQAGRTGMTQAWGAWSDYGGLRRSHIIAWKPLPKACPRRPEKPAHVPMTDEQRAYAWKHQANRDIE